MKRALVFGIASLMLSTMFSAFFLATALDAKEIQVKGYTKKDGTKVAGYTKTVKDKDSKTPETSKVAGYTKKDGTKVKGYMRSTSTK